MTYKQFKFSQSQVLDKFSVAYEERLHDVPQPTFNQRFSSSYFCMSISVCHIKIGF